MRIRRSVYEIEGDPDDDTLTWYGKAIGVLKSRPITAHDSWRFQAAIHDFDKKLDPLAQPGETLPPDVEQARYWSQCQHGSWFFIPWHRMYLHHFEQIIAAAVVSLGGPEDWALPYWNYSKDMPSRLLPPSFRTPSGGPSNLFVAQRTAAANAGQTIADEADVDIDGCLTTTPFTGAPFGNPGFGGGQTGFSHGGMRPGRLEIIPHGSIHNAVGGPGGFMSAFNTAGLDPIFWLHHCNIDRLWEVWRARDAGNADPANAQWLSGVSFRFRAVDGMDVSMTCGQMVDTTAAPLYYKYDDISDPIEEGFGIGVGVGVGAIAGTPELIGASDEPVDVDPAGGAARCVVRAPRGTPGTEAFGIGSAPERIYLHLEHLTCAGFANALDVYLGIAEGANPEDSPRRRIARIPLFGIREASEASGSHGGEGLTFMIEVTQAFEALDDDGDGDFRDVPITLHPVGEQGEHHVRVGRISLYAE